MKQGPESKPFGSEKVEMRRRSLVRVGKGTEIFGRYTTTNDSKIEVQLR